MRRPNIDIPPTIELPPTPPPTTDDDGPGKRLDAKTTRPMPEAPAVAPIWWSNAIFFVGMHVLGIVGAFFVPLTWKTALLCVASWQTATFGITVGYHRLWSHRAFSAKLPLRIILAGFGCLGFQGSIKWWVLRHRLHHRFTDGPDDPYDAQRGLLFSHVGWIFRRPTYPRMAQIDRKDLDADPVVRFQHKYYLPLTLGLGLVLPTLIGMLWGDALGGYMYGGIVARLLIWHFTFFINSLAHYLGEQQYSLDVTARGNALLAILTGGEAKWVHSIDAQPLRNRSHNFHHAYPMDYRNGPRPFDIDASKWFIWACSKFTPWITRMHVTPESEIYAARAAVLHERAEKSRTGPTPLDPSTLPVWPLRDVTPNVRQLTEERMKSGSLKRPLVVLIDGYAVDAGVYARDHPGGVAILRTHAVKTDDGDLLPIDASDAFNGGLNNHLSAARRLMEELRIARIEG